MAKDPKDPGTIDGLPSKIGRPVLDPARGPMSHSERQAKYRAGKKVVQFRIDESEKAILDNYCKKNRISRDELLSVWIKTIQ